MRPIFDFTSDDHATMLSDQVRLEAYKRAIQNQVKEGMCVVEVGTGTGILSAYAATRTKAPIYAIESNPASADFARKMMKAADYHQVQILEGKSYEINLPNEPDLILTETIGAIGPEEHIVEICHDLKKRYPKIKTFIPSVLRVCAVPIHLPRITRWEEDYCQAFKSATDGAFDYQKLAGEIHERYSARIRYDDLMDSKETNEAKVLIEYKLGESSEPEFDVEFRVDPKGDWNAIHLYFEAVLDDEVLLSTHFLDPYTHWKNAFVSKRLGATSLQVRYRAEDERLTVFWNQPKL